MPLVSVPVLSEKSIFKLPEVSIPTNFRTSTLSFSIRFILEDSTTVIIIGSPSGTATTITVMARVRACKRAETIKDGVCKASEILAIL